jgi:hypothetical protein
MNDDLHTLVVSLEKNQKKNGNRSPSQTGAAVAAEFS